MKAPLIIFSARCSLALLMWSLPPSGPHFFDWLTKSSQTKSVIAEMVRVGVVRGMFILRFFPCQLKILPDRVLIFLSSPFDLITFPVSSNLGDSVHSTSFLSNSHMELSSCSCSCSVLSFMDSSSSSSSVTKCVNYYVFISN